MEEEAVATCLRCRTALEVATGPKVVCTTCGSLQPHVSTDVGEYFDCLECSEPLIAPARDGTTQLVCSECGASRAYVRGPMVVITGSPGVGKSALATRLADRLETAVVLEPPERNLTSRDPLAIMTWFKDWLLLGAQVAQGGRYLVIPSFARPSELDALPERAWVGAIHWLVLVCEPDALADRLKRRRKSRDIDASELKGLLGINEEMRELANNDPRVVLLDSTHMTPPEVADRAAALIESWIP